MRNITAEMRAAVERFSVAMGSKVTPVKKIRSLVPILEVPFSSRKMESTAAAVITRPSLESSEGWMVLPKMLIHREAPFTLPEHRATTSSIQEKKRMKTELILYILQGRRCIIQARIMPAMT